MKEINKSENSYSKPKFTIGVFGIILNNSNEVLLCHRTDYDLWNLPGGGLEEGETPWEGVIREIKEETGLDTEIIKLNGIYSKPNKSEIVFTFYCKKTGGELCLNDEADKLQYFNQNNLPKKISPKHIERISDHFDTSKNVKLKIQQGKSTIELFNLSKTNNENGRKI